MEHYIMLISAFFGLFISFCWQFNIKAGDRFINTRIPDNSFFRKIYTFKEDTADPLLYVKFIPFLIAILIFISVLIAYVVFWINPNLLYNFLKSDGCIVGSLAYSAVSVIYLIVLQL